MFKSTKRILVATVMTISVAAPCAAAADIPIHKYVDKSSPNLYTGGTSTAQSAPPAK